MPAYQLKLKTLKLETDKQNYLRNDQLKIYKRFSNIALYWPNNSQLFNFSPFKNKAMTQKIIKNAG